LELEEKGVIGHQATVARLWHRAGFIKEQTLSVFDIFDVVLTRVVIDLMSRSFQSKNNGLNDDKGEYADFISTSLVLMRSTGKMKRQRLR